MSNYIAHFAITTILPLACGFVAGLFVRVQRRRWFTHAWVIAATVLLTIGVQYGSFLVLQGLMTGDWPQAITAEQFIYAFRWFAMFAVFTALPQVIAGYAVALVTKGCTIRQTPPLVN